MPDKFEAGTLPLPAIVGLHASLGWLKEQDITNIRAHELTLTQRLLDGLAALEQQGLVSIVGRRDCKERIGVVSITAERIDLAELAYLLAENYAIATRVGLHCAPSAHKTLGTYPTGTLRFSCGWHNTQQDIDAALDALEKVLRHH